ncbi:hypothetical protein PMAYCL1PPCAC_05686 [Pristionchus mayeri]|uniref:VTT domain-containing protein n=1 Tax=Pristionchus mayeri TaxID=1317129 RepID=A0AAN4Z7C7_9BILA|nr:hypothetical protein PMAYCL1PPCAC_05686 [Pristionchus mayeri]
MKMRFNHSDFFNDLSGVTAVPPSIDIISGNSMNSFGAAVNDPSISSISMYAVASKVFIWLKNPRRHDILPRRRHHGARLFILPAIFAVSSLSLWYMLCSAPDWNSEGLTTFELSRQFENFSVLAKKFKAYKDHHFSYVTAVFISLYLFQQSFAIPGLFFLNILAGVVFDMAPGFALVCVLTTIGSVLCYRLSELFGRDYVLYYFGQKLTYLQQKVEDNSNRLVPFLLFARMFPVSPSWMLNIVAPFLNIPLPIFALTVLIGLAPYNFICVQAGFALSELRSWEDVFTTRRMVIMGSLALVPLAYAVFMRPRAEKMEDESESISDIYAPLKTEVV